VIIASNFSVSKDDRAAAKIRDAQARLEKNLHSPHRAFVHGQRATKTYSFRLSGACGLTATEAHDK
jgi:hypothetical protein